MDLEQKLNLIRAVTIRVTGVKDIRIRRGIPSNGWERASFNAYTQGNRATVYVGMFLVEHHVTGSLRFFIAKTGMFEVMPEMDRDIITNDSYELIKAFNDAERHTNEDND